MELLRHNQLIADGTLWNTYETDVFQFTLFLPFGNIRDVASFPATKEALLIQPFQRLIKLKGSRAADISLDHLIQMIMALISTAEMKT